MSDAARLARDTNINAAISNLKQVVRSGPCDSKTLLLSIGACIVLVGILGIGNAAAKLTVRPEHEEEDKCGFMASDVVLIVQSLLVVVVGLLQIRKSLCK